MQRPLTARILDRIVRYKSYPLALSKIKANIRAGHNVLSLTPIERQEARKKLLRRTVWLPTQRLSQALRTSKDNDIVNFHATLQRTQSVEAHPTFLFIHQILVERRDYKDTTLFQMMVEGDANDRSAAPKQTRFGIQGEDPYHAKCLALIESVQRAGYLWSTRKEKTGDTNILVAIGDNGSFLHYKRGHHRLAIAHALAIENIPVDIEWVSGRFLIRFIDKRLLAVPGHISRGISRCIEHAAAQNGACRTVVAWLCLASLASS